MEKVSVKHLSDKDWYLQDIKNSQHPTGKNDLVRKCVSKDMEKI